MLVCTCLVWCLSPHAPDHQCPAGQYGAGNGFPSAVCSGPCDAGRYGSASMTASTCQGPCQAGYSCPAGSTSATAVACVAGQFSTSGSAFCSQVCCVVLFRAFLCPFLCPTPHHVALVARFDSLPPSPCCHFVGFSAVPCREVQHQRRRRVPTLHCWQVRPSWLSCADDDLRGPLPTFHVPVCAVTTFVGMAPRQACRPRLARDRAPLANTACQLPARARFAPPAFSVPRRH